MKNSPGNTRQNKRGKKSPLFEANEKVPELTDRYTSDLQQEVFKSQNGPSESHQSGSLHTNPYLSAKSKGTILIDDQLDLKVGRNGESTVSFGPG